MIQKCHKHTDTLLEGDGAALHCPVCVAESSKKQAARERFEDGSEQFDREIQPLVSIAYSLRRIADAMSETNEYGEGPAKAIGAGIVRALQNH